MIAWAHSAVVLVEAPIGNVLRPPVVLGGCPCYHRSLASSRLPSSGRGTSSSEAIVAEIGVDIIEIPRIAEAIGRFGDRFLRRVYTEREIAKYRDRAPSLATRFAAKEAVMKVLGTGARGVGWHDIEILSDERGKPVVFLHGRAAERAQAIGIASIAVSLSDSKEYAVAVALGN